MQDPFVGTWTLNVTRSEFDANHHPSQGTMTWRLEKDGVYLMLAEGRDGAGKPVAEKPQRLVADGTAYPIEGLPGLTSVTTRPAANTIRAEARREDGSLAGEGTYVVAEDGKSMTATTAGFDTQLRRFSLRTVWDRI